ncbi:MAG: hypothetical protein HY530_08715 [Chloroflexi bacterium]|nr:hypothetical protein [Chloroflexota bacterium]
MPTAIAVLATLSFIGWVIYRALRGKRIKAYMVSYGVAIITGVFTYGFFLSMNMPRMVKIVVSILLGIALIVIAAYLQRRTTSKPAA